MNFLTKYIPKRFTKFLLLRIFIGPLYLLLQSPGELAAHTELEIFFLGGRDLIHNNAGAEPGSEKKTRSDQLLLPGVFFRTHSTGNNPEAEEFAWSYRVGATLTWSGASHFYRRPSKRTGLITSAYDERDQEGQENDFRLRPENENYLGVSFCPGLICSLKLGRTGAPGAAGRLFGEAAPRNGIHFFFNTPFTGDLRLTPLFRPPGKSGAYGSRLDYSKAILGRLLQAGFFYQGLTLNQCPAKPVGLTDPPDDCPARLERGGLALGGAFVRARREFTYRLSLEDLRGYRRVEYKNEFGDKRARLAGLALRGGFAFQGRSFFFQSSFFVPEPRGRTRGSVAGTSESSGYILGDTNPLQGVLLRALDSAPAPQFCRFEDCGGEFRETWSPGIRRHALVIGGEAGLRFSRLPFRPDTRGVSDVVKGEYRLALGFEVLRPLLPRETERKIDAAFRGLRKQSGYLYEITPRLSYETGVGRLEALYSRLIQVTEEGRRRLAGESFRILFVYRPFGPEENQ